MSIREQLKLARTHAGLSQDALARASGTDNGHISRFERGTRSADTKKLEAWLDACGMTFVAVPVGAADPRELDMLEPTQRELVLRLARLVPHLSRDNARTLLGLVNAWEEDQDMSATSQDKRASIS